MGSPNEKEFYLEALRLNDSKDVAVAKKWWGVFSSKSFVRFVNEKSTEESADETESGDTSDENADGKAA